MCQKMHISCSLGYKAPSKGAIHELLPFLGAGGTIAAVKMENGRRPMKLHSWMVVVSRHSIICLWMQRIGRHLGRDLLLRMWPRSCWKPQR